MTMARIKWRIDTKDRFYFCPTSLKTKPMALPNSASPNMPPASCPSTHWWGSPHLEYTTHLYLLSSLHPLISLGSARLPFYISRIFLFKDLFI